MLLLLADRWNACECSTKSSLTAAGDAALSSHSVADASAGRGGERASRAWLNAFVPSRVLRPISLIYRDAKRRLRDNGSSNAATSQQATPTDGKDATNAASASAAAASHGDAMATDETTAGDADDAEEESQGLELDSVFERAQSLTPHPHLAHDAPLLLEPGLESFAWPLTVPEFRARVIEVR